MMTALPTWQPAASAIVFGTCVLFIPATTSVVYHDLIIASAVITRSGLSHYLGASFHLTEPLSEPDTSNHTSQALIPHPHSDPKPAPIRSPLGHLQLLMPVSKDQGSRCPLRNRSVGKTCIVRSSACNEGCLTVRAECLGALARHTTPSCLVLSGTCSADVVFKPRTPRPHTYMLLITPALSACVAVCVYLQLSSRPHMCWAPTA